MSIDSVHPPRNQPVRWEDTVRQRATDVAVRRIDGLRTGSDQLHFVRAELDNIAAAGQRIDPPQIGPSWIEPPDNGGSYAGMVLAAVMAGGGVYIGLSMSWIFGIIALIAAVWFGIISAVMYTTKGAAAKQAAERAQHRLESDIRERAHATTKIAYEAAAAAFCSAMGVPERFRSEIEGLVRSGDESTFVSTMERLARRPRYGDAPVPTAERVEPSAYEYFCAVWMQHKGASGVRVTQRSRDGGIDITSDHFVAQCKRYAGAVAVKEIRDLFGAATVKQKQSMFFTTGRYTAAGLSFAEEAGVALFVLATDTDRAVAVSSAAQTLSAKGLNPDEW